MHKISRNYLSMGCKFVSLNNISPAILLPGHGSHNSALCFFEFSFFIYMYKWYHLSDLHNTLCQSSFFSHSWKILPYVSGGNYEIFLIYSPIYRYLGCLCILAILKNPVVNIGMLMFSFVYGHTERIVGLHMVVQFLILWEASKLFSTVSE